MNKLTVVVLTLALSVIACGKQVENNAETAQKTQSAPDTATHGAAGALPGSYEDWCGGHGVPESVCTRCNASLIAAFKATNDWCAEHGLPETHCLRCNPNLKIVRPPKPGSI